MKIVTKYILKEHVGPLTFALSTLTSLLLLNYIARRFGDLVGKGIPARAIAEYFVLSVPFTIAMTLPMAVLVATLYAFSRIAAENEITAFKASGVSMPRLMVPVLVGASALTVLMVLFNDQVLPRANHRLTTLQSDIGRTKPTFALKEQVMNSVGTNATVYLRASEVSSAANTMQDVVIYDLNNPSERRTIFADSGELAFAPNRKDLLITLHHGHVQELGNGKPEQLRRTFYERLIVRQRDVADSFDPSQESSGFKGDREMTICEMQGAYVKSRREWLAASHELARTTAELARKPAPPPLQPERATLSLGGLYCRATTGLFSVKSAEAAELPRPTAALTQDTAAARRRADSTARAAAQDSARRAAPPVPTPMQTPAARPPVTPPATQPPATQPPPVRPDSQRPVPVQAVPLPPVPSQPVPVPVPVPTNTPQPSSGAPVPMSFGALPNSTVPPAGTPVPAGSMPPAPVVTGGIAAPSMGGGGSMLDIARLRVEDSRNSMNGYAVEIHKKFALAVACIVFVLMGAPIALRFPRGGVGLVIGVSLGVFALYYCGLIAGESLANKGYMPPALAMWAANILFTIVGLVLLSRMGNESGSARGGGLGELLAGVGARFRRRGRAA